MTLEVAILPWGDETRQTCSGWGGLAPSETDTDWEPPSYGDTFALTAQYIQDIWSPLEILRGIGKFSIRGADPNEMSDFAISDSDISPRLEALLSDVTTYQSRLIELIQGNTEVEIFHKIYHDFLKYVQTFERIDRFRCHMALANRDMETNKYSPFRNTHPVEIAIEKATAM